MSNLLPGFINIDKKSSTLKEKLFARRKWLMMQRDLLDWSQEELAKRMGIMLIEYQLFEEGKIVDLPDLSIEDIRYYLKNHINKIYS